MAILRNIWSVLAVIFASTQATIAATNSIGELPTLNIKLASPPEMVFDTSNSCEMIDIPDAPARAFRDYHNVVHLIATHYVARGMTGSNLDTVTHDCQIMYRSPKDPNPANFRDNSWLYAFYTFDGKKIAALVHSEFDAWEIPGLCATPTQHSNCWWNTVTFAESNNGGYTFVVPEPPHNLVASPPYAYHVGNIAGAYGYSQPTNIVKRDNFFYALINTWPYLSQAYGPCLIRTDHPFDPSSWRAWDGVGFHVRFADPYRTPEIKPEDHACKPVYAGTAESLVLDPKSGLFITTQFTPDNRFGPSGVYLMLSPDLIHWSKPMLLVSDHDLASISPLGNWSFGYSSILDPDSSDRNFTSVSSRPYLYYVRFDQSHPPYTRALLRRALAIEVRENS